MEDELNRYCGIDWAEDHHDIAIVDAGGTLIAKKRISDDLAGFTELTRLLTEAGDTAEEPIPIVSVTFRRIKNDRLAAVGWVWAASMVMNSGPAQQHYRQRRQRGDRHAPAVRHLFNKMLGQLYHCLQTRQVYDSAKAFGPLIEPEPTTAA
ncbi:transposase [Nocardia sp. NPDC051832]|uniref:IS110 family transposase n=1 Tax=Nocardia sp. NPDC051832 TaxID=3155673 RepID=UPI003426BBE7